VAVSTFDVRRYSELHDQRSPSLPGVATELTATATHARAGPARGSVQAWMATYLPWRTVVLPWILARILVICGMSWPTSSGATHELRPYRLLILDGQWFKRIATTWYHGPFHPRIGTVFPFFPLYPTLVGGLLKLGAPQLPAFIGISWIAALVAIAGAHRLAVRHLPARAAPWATWFLALAPGAITMVMGYSDSLYLAGLVWAVVLAEDRRWWAAGLTAAVATAARPNGWIAAVAVVFVVGIHRGWRPLVAVVTPPAAFLIGWCWYLWSLTGDALAFYHAKSAWYEIPIASLLADSWRTSYQPAWFHVLWALTLVVPFVATIRRQPLSWIAVVVLSVVPSLFLGTVGLARYAILAFPLPFAVADVLTARARTFAVAGLAACAAWLVALSWLVAARTWLP
jgi:hypothetical protein